MPALQVESTDGLTRIELPGHELRQRPVVSITTAPEGFEGEGFPVRRAFGGVDLAALDPFVHLDQMGEVDYAPGEPKGTPWHPFREPVTWSGPFVMNTQDELRQAFADFRAGKLGTEPESAHASTDQVAEQIVAGLD